MFNLDTDYAPLRRKDFIEELINEDPEDLDPFDICDDLYSFEQAEYEDNNIDE